MSEHVLLAGCGDEVHQVLGRLLTKSGLTVQIATGVSEAITSLWSEPAMVVVDLAMGNGGGLEVVKTTRTLGLQAQLAVLSSGAEAPGTNWIARYRPDAIFGKPLDFGDFVGWMSEFDISNIAIPLEIVRQAA